jgi:hypothetical protein
VTTHKILSARIQDRDVTTRLAFVEEQSMITMKPRETEFGEHDLHKLIPDSTN